jgi:zinc protease
MNRLEFDAAQDQIGAQLSVGPNFSLKVLPQKFGAGVKLLAKDLREPALPKKGFTRTRFIQTRQAAGQLKSPQFKFRLAIAKALWPKGDPARRIVTPRSIGSLKLKNVSAYHHKVYRPDETTIVVMGDITPDKAKSVVKHYFGDWAAKGKKPTTDYPAAPASKATRVFVPDKLKKQDMVVLAETLGLTYKDPDHFALSLANDLLSGALYASPLYHVLREKLGLVYNVGSQFDFMRHRATFKLHYGSYPGKVNQAHKAALRVLGRTMAKPLSDSQLHLAKSIGLRRIELGKSSVDAIAGDWLSRAQDDLPLNWDYVIAHHYEQLTAPEIQKALKAHFDPDRLSTIILGQPAKK